MNLKNYTSEIEAYLSIAKIEKLLVEAGATDINKSYIEGVCHDIRFRLVIDTMPLFFKFPANIQACYNVMKKAIIKPQEKTFDRLKKQAERTAWKILSDWTELQLSMIQMEQAKPLQIFLSYVYDPLTDQTFFQKIESNTKLLLN